MNADGSGVSRLRTGTDPAWSPDGSRIAFAQQRSDDRFRSDVCVMRADGSGLINLTANLTRYASRAPTWSPDGGRIAFSSADDGDFYHFQLWVMNADGSGATRVHSNNSDLFWYVTAPAWSPL
jgi:TolB protein